MRQEKYTFYPRAQLRKLLERCGKPELAREKVVSDDSGYKVILMDRNNNTMEKVLAGLESLIAGTVCRS